MLHVQQKREKPWGKIFSVQNTYLVHAHFTSRDTWTLWFLRVTWGSSSGSKKLPSSSSSDTSMSLPEVN